MTHIDNIPHIIENGITHIDSDNANNDKKRRKEAEFLAANNIPVAAIGRYIVYNDVAKRKMIGFGIDEAMIIVRPDYYF
jgi:hypothetical protein